MAAKQFYYPFEAPLAELDTALQEILDKEEPRSPDEDAETERLRKRREELAEQIFSSLTAYQRVMLARHPDRPQTADYLDMIVEDFVELHGDRRFSDDASIVCGLGRIEQTRMMIVGQQKGKDTQERLKCNFGMTRPEGFRKALLKMQLAERFGLPVLTLVDTKGAAADVGAEERGEGLSIAENMAAMSCLRTPVVCVIIGEGCSGGALGIGVADRYGILENAYYTVISPEGCAAILYHDAKKAEEAAAALHLTAREVHELGVFDEVMRESGGGAHRDPQSAADAVKEFVLRSLDELRDLSSEELLRRRYERHRRLGFVLEGKDAELARARWDGEAVPEEDVADDVQESAAEE